ncbi:zinc finger protein (macronuclear) [Tetrahymena thermophila SB210]|uniref:Zinc finger protein n=1 Tax=Tetrahymena thermophila (strain SB210) TaxID=312017 RepID=I7LZF1_TETTS|nr:zinc finger protein [Tetrahymena thermophila SB210]EAR83767.1 zinc finger protein [Tetrahymena thermophila SB210]|eukprot:XP_001031430.1 zinc finger protein [Tetrahymena thermophila SB210]
MLVVDNICVFALIYIIYFMICLTIIYQFSSFAIDFTLSIFYAFYYIIIQGGCYSYTLIFNNYLTQTIFIPFYKIAQFIYATIISNYVDFVCQFMRTAQYDQIFKLELIMISTTTLYIIYKIAWITYAYFKIINNKEITPQFYYNEDCCFCFCSLNQLNDEIEVLKCKHAFHTSCMSKYIIHQNSQQSLYFKKQDQTINCPHCRTPIYRNNEKKEACDQFMLNMQFVGYS